MLSKVASRLDLRRLILLLSVVVAAATLSNTLYSTYRVQKEQLIESTVEANRAYASKLSDTIDQFLDSAQQQVSFSASLLGKSHYNHEVAISEAKRLKLQTDSFNAVVMVDAEGNVITVSPDTVQVRGGKLQTPGAVEALTQRKPLISEPYVSAAGNLVIIVSSPVFDDGGTYLGYVGGAIYLKQRSILHNLIGSHFYRDDAYVYVVDASKTILYHPDPERVGKTVGENEVVDKVLGGENGGALVVNFLGREMLAGYSPVKSVGWGVVSLQSVERALLPMDSLIYRSIIGILPMAVIGILGMFWLSGFISRPLSQLAECAKNMQAPETSQKIISVQSWYFESALIRKALLQGVALTQARIVKLNKEVQTDPLTGLLNRRALSAVLDVLRTEYRPFSLVTLDIDHFKQVNDQYGHDVGDAVLKKLAGLMQACSRDSDYACRVGGEEFLILLPEVSLDAASEFAERLRVAVQQDAIDIVGSITISLGVAHWPGSADDITDVLKAADEEMYLAKQQGRNRVSVRPDRIDA
ncbi:diguanylate cyclase (GGDEF)-like protein [Pseudomonas sp. JUb42]|uniref:sensor domain-containing diguanylate cyclase n=1 Tax=Pseudomonas sp. JUb42 TaxID=2940611 RepID=UPI002168FBF0|nr:sensor domain-containing diguanylate cyclase [Pseudomonas sp. JUb42]MCS3471906.1 diguanylate cyclase (GGDEF)-like protein [Pseudomonas sp. JUb42]